MSAPDVSSSNAEMFISSIQEIESRYSEFPKSLRIRIERWVEKLVDSGSNPAFTAHRNAYTKLLLSMVRTARFNEPFHRMPPDGRLAPFPTHLRSRIRNIDAPPAASQDAAGSASEDGFWGDMRSRVSGTDHLNSSRSGYLHVAPVAASVHELASEELERAHSNTLAFAPPKKGVAASPVRSPHRNSRSRARSPQPPPDAQDATRPTYEHLLQAHFNAGDNHSLLHEGDFRKYAVPNYRFQWNLHRDEESEHASTGHVTHAALAHGDTNDDRRAHALHAPVASHTPIRTHGGNRAALQSHATGAHHAEHAQHAQHALAAHKAAFPAGHGADVLVSTARPSGSGSGMSRFLNMSSEQASGLSHKRLDQQNLKQFKEPDYTSHELPALHSLLREQNVRIQVLEERLAVERSEHARQIQHIEYAYATEMARLREVEANANRLYEQQSQREMDIIEMHHRNSGTGIYYSNSNNNSVRNSGNIRSGMLSQSGTGNSATNLDTGREYVSLEFDRAYEGVASSSIGGGLSRSSTLQQNQQRNRSMSQESPETSKHHLIHISSPPPRLPGKTSPIPKAAAGSRNTGSDSGLAPPGRIQFPEHDNNVSMLGRSFAQQSQRWVNDSMSRSQDYFLPPAPAPLATSASAAMLRESRDKDDSDFLAYLSAFQEEIRYPNNPFKVA